MYDNVFSYLVLLWTRDFVERHPSVRDIVMDSLMELDRNALQRIFSADKYLLKGVREAFRDILVKCGLSNNFRKVAIGEQYGQAFVKMLQDYFDGLREPETSLVHFSVQLLTVSSVLSGLLSTKLFYEGLCQVFGAYIVKSDWFSKLFVSNFSMAISIFRYIFKDPLIMSAHSGDHFYFFKTFFDNIVMPFEMMNEQTRELHTHVLFESNSWTLSFSIHLLISELLALLVNSFDARTSFEAAKYLMSISLKHTIGRSFHSVIITALSVLIRRIFSLCSESKEDFKALMTEACYGGYFDEIAKRAAEIIGFSVEIESNLWVRNGPSMRTQVNLILVGSHRVNFALGATVPIFILSNDIL